LFDVEVPPVIDRGLNKRDIERKLKIKRATPIGVAFFESRAENYGEAYRQE
jgi:hypothetical protein